MPDRTADSQFERYVRRTLAALPEPIARQVDGVVVCVMEYPDPETMTEMGVTDAFDLLGLYHGVSINNKSVFDPGYEPDLVFLYRQPILAYARATGQTLEAVVRHVTIHEIGHHFGFSDEDMDALEEMAERGE